MLSRRRRPRIEAATSIAVAAWAALPLVALGACVPGQKPIYLTFDTGSQSQAELIRDVLKKHDVKATFFMANEKTVKGDWSLDPSWAWYWKSLVADGHAFGTHTFDHVYYRRDSGADKIEVRLQFGANTGRTVTWNPAQYCSELNRVKTRFRELTGAEIGPFWRAPGGKISRRLVAIGEECGYRHFGWAEAGFLGDELPSDKYPNRHLLKRALKNLQPGDIAMAHLGIWSRKEPFAPMLDPLIAGLKAKGFCFATLREYPTIPVQPKS